MNRIWEGLWERSQKVAKRWGVNPLVLLILYLSLYIWLPVAAVVRLPLWLKGVVTVVFYVVPFVYGGMGLVRRSFRTRSVDLRVLTLNEGLFAELFGEIVFWVRMFWRGEPWGEYLRCPACAGGVGMYSSRGAISFERAQELGLGAGDSCPICDAALELFWSDEAIRQYFAEIISAPDYIGVAAFVGEEFAGWAVGYRKWWGDEGVFYVDTIAIVPGFRRSQWRYRLMNVFTHRLMVPALRKGYSRMLFRTHLKAPWVGDISKVYGFRFNGVVSKEDTARGYWLAKLNWLVIARALLAVSLAGLANRVKKRTSRKNPS